MSKCDTLASGIQTDLVGYWPFNDNSGLYASDKSGNTNLSPGVLNSAGWMGNVACSLTATKTKEVLRLHFSVYPNPASNHINIELDYISASDLSVEIYAIRGQMIQRMPLEQLYSSVDISSLSKGVYLLCLVSDSAILETKRFFKR